MGYGGAGVTNSVFGLLTMAVLFCLWVFKWMVVGAVIVVITLGRLVYYTVCYFRERKQLKQEAAKLTEPPMPPATKVL